jgi:hypothetical protein
MALAKLSNRVLSMHGRFAGQYFKHDNAGQHIQAHPRTIKVFSTGRRAAWAQSFTAIATLWIAAIGPYVIFWDIFASGNIFGRPGKEPKFLTGYNWFCHYNVGRLYALRNPYYKPPRSSKWLPDYVIQFEVYPSPNNNMYKQSTLINGKPWYREQFVERCLWWYMDRWIISHTTGDPHAILRWERIGEDPIGYYFPILPEYGAASVTL